MATQCVEKGWFFLAGTCILFFLEFLKPYPPFQPIEKGLFRTKYLFWTPIFAFSFKSFLNGHLQRVQNGGQLANASTIGWALMWDPKRPICKASCGTRVYWNSGQ